MVRRLLLCTALAWSGCATPPRPANPIQAALQKSIAYLEREVPAWSRENNCFSCHNNGDGARALFASRIRGVPVPASATDDTLSWLQKPTAWDHNKGDPGFSDIRLADLQFFTSLAAAEKAGLVRESRALAQAADRVVAGQAVDGSWPIDQRAPAGSPATYGTPLATHLAVESLQRIPGPTARAAITRGRDWLRACPIETIPSAAAVLLAFPQPSGTVERTRRDQALGLLQRGQHLDGGWGPFADSASEPYDTALALLALDSLADSAAFLEARRKGEKFLLTEQRPDGSWPATTRPRGGQSYAQHISTSAWAAMALLKSK